MISPRSGFVVSGSSSGREVLAVLVLDESSKSHAILSDILSPSALDSLLMAAFIPSEISEPTISRQSRANDPFS